MTFANEYDDLHPKNYVLLSPIETISSMWD